MRIPGYTIAAVACLLLFGSACRSQGPPPAPGGIDWRVTAENLRQDVAAADRQHAAAAPDARDSNLPLALLEIEKIQLRLGARWQDAGWVAAQNESVALVEACLRRLAAGEVAQVGETGAETPEGYFHRAYLSRNDASPQPYYLRLPDDYDPAQSYPLIVFLHGYVPETSKVDPWVLPAAQWKMATDRGFIFVLPHGRRNTDFLGVGEVDVLRVIEECQRFYNVDSDRIFMAGCSMGGYGGWAIGLRQPDRFAALALMSGQTDFFTWERRPRDQTRFKSWCILQNNPLDLAPNARHLPMLLQHGAEDHLVPVVHSRLIAPVMQQLGYDLEYHEIEGQGHYIYWDDPPFERMFDWCRDKRRVDPPARVTFTTYTPKQGQAWWVDVRRLTQWGPPAVIDAEVTAEEVIVTAKNVAELWLDPPAALVPARRALRVNGQPAGEVGGGPRRVVIQVDRVKAAEPGTPPVNRPRLGPAREVFNGPFRVIYATGGSAEQRTRNKTSAERFQRIWWAFAEGQIEVVPDTALGADAAADHNLVIFGEPGTVQGDGLAGLAVAIPEGVTIASGRYTVAGKAYHGEGLGMVLLTPHPSHAQRLILWWSGAPYGDGLPINHQFDLLPDLLVYGSEIAWDGTNQFLVGGFLDQDWRLDPALLDVAAP